MTETIAVTLGCFSLAGCLLLACSVAAAAYKLSPYMDEAEDQVVGHPAEAQPLQQNRRQ